MPFFYLCYVCGANKQPAVSQPFPLTTDNLCHNYFVKYENWLIKSKLTGKLCEYVQSAKYCNGTLQQ